MANPYLLLIKMHMHRRHLFYHMHPVDLKSEDSIGKAMVGDGVFIFCVIIFDFEKAVNRCQAPMLLPQGDPDSRYFPHKVGEKAPRATYILL